uniref:30S ribosomal protein S6 n=1 Tax=Oryza barthii TaxID=65489 RepID=A0A0D3HVR1_9ORYZ
MEATAAPRPLGKGGEGEEEEERVDTHSFAPKAGEATGPFPEAVLLRKKMVKDDGQVAPEFADADEVRHYEVVYLIHEDRVEEVEDVVSKVQDFVREKKGRIWRLNNWGLRRLAYKIKKARHANYILMNFEIQAKYINDFKTLLDKDERIIRHLVMKRDEAITEDCSPPPEFHTLRAQQQYMDDEYIDDEDDGEEEQEPEEDWDDKGEMENAGYEDDDEPEIILVDEVERDNNENSRRRNRTMKVEKYAAEKVLR